MFITLQKNCPDGITEMFQFSFSDDHNLRSNINLMLRLAKPKTNAMKKSFTRFRVQFGYNMHE